MIFDLPFSIDQTYVCFEIVGEYASMFHYGMCVINGDVILIMSVSVIGGDRERCRQYPIFFVKGYVTSDLPTFNVTLIFEIIGALLPDISFSLS